jgi:hypothetical protein
MPKPDLVTILRDTQRELVPPVVVIIFAMAT